MRWLTNGLRHPDGAGLATSSALTRARQRLGARPLELLSGLRCGPLAAAGTPGAFAFGLRLAAWDGTGIDAADTPANAAAFGGVQGGAPQLRLLALIECGTHALIGAVSGGVARASEQKLARRLLPALGPGMLLLADRNFPGWELQGLAAGTGADLAWRIKKNLVFTPLQVLPDGSFLSVMPTPAENLHTHIDTFGVAPDGRIFSSEKGHPVASTAISDVWAEARTLALTPAQVASPLAGRPYDLRHAAVSLWLAAGVPPPRVAERAGHSVEVLLRVYAKCLDDGEDIANTRIDAALGDA